MDVGLTGREDGAGAVLGPLVGPETVLHMPHLHVRPVARHLLHDGLHLVVFVVPRVVAEVWIDLSEASRPDTVDTPLSQIWEMLQILKENIFSICYQCERSGGLGHCWSSPCRSCRASVG